MRCDMDREKLFLGGKKIAKLINFGKSICVLAALTSVGVKSVDAIVFNNREFNNLQKSGFSHKLQENRPSESQTIKRGYIGSFEDNYNYAGVGSNDHSIFHYNHETFDGFDDEHHQHHVHHGHQHGEPYLHHHHLHHVHKYHEHDDTAYQKAQVIKGLLVPLAGVALLGAAAALVSNPILLQLGVISGAPLGRRKREAEKIPKNHPTNAEYLKGVTPLNEIKLLESFMAEIPKEEMETQQQKIMANLLSCSGIASDPSCLERLACELYSIEGVSMPIETNVLSIIANKILNNDFVANDTKIKISKAIERGRRNSGCLIYECDAFQGGQLPKKVKKKAFRLREKSKMKSFTKMGE